MDDVAVSPGTKSTLSLAATAVLMQSLGPGSAVRRHGRHCLQRERFWDAGGSVLTKRAAFTVFTSFTPKWRYQNGVRT